MISINKRLMKSFFVLPFVLGMGSAAISASESFLLIDDFSSPGTSMLGTQWQGFSDRVMGGISDLNAGYVAGEDGSALRMVGNVSLENNGGFVQVRLPLRQRGVFDASEYTGIALEVRGVPGSYYLHLRTRATVMPWQYYDAPIPVREEWTRVEIPFSSFVAQSSRMELNPGALASLAIAGAKAEFAADITVRRIEFYR